VPTGSSSSLKSVLFVPDSDLTGAFSATLASTGLAATAGGGVTIS